MSRKEYNIVLDLDETLIRHEKAFMIKAYGFYSEENSDKLICHEYDYNSYIVERPYLQEFLDYVFENFNVSIWTAGEKGYANFVVNNIILKKENREIDYLLHREHCLESYGLTGNIKDMSLIWNRTEGYQPHNTILVDDLVDTCNSQKEYCVPIAPFRLSIDTNDNALLTLMLAMKKTFEYFEIGKTNHSKSI